MYGRQGRCIGFRACEALCPDIFAVGDDGVAGVMNHDLAPTDACAAEAAARCPQGTIVHVDE